MLDDLGCAPLRIRLVELLTRSVVRVCGASFCVGTERLSCYESALVVAFPYPVFSPFYHTLPPIKSTAVPGCVAAIADAAVLLPVCAIVCGRIVGAAVAAPHDDHLGASV